MSSSFRRTVARAAGLASSLASGPYQAARRWLMAGQAELHPECHVHPTARLLPLAGDPSAIRVGAHTHLRGELLTAAHGGSIQIGEWCYLGEGSRLWSASQITVGDRVLISHGCEIHDWNAHPIDAQRRHEHFAEIVGRGHPREIDDIDSAPIHIEDDAWIGFGVTILKGVRIGARSIVAARSVVVDDVPPDCIVAGFPARAIRSL